MKKNNNFHLLILALSLIVLLLTSCNNTAADAVLGEEEETSAATSLTDSQPTSGDVSANSVMPSPAASPEETASGESSQPSVQPSASVSEQPSSEPSAQISAQPSSNVSPTPDNVTPTPVDGDETDYFALGEVLVETETLGQVRLFMLESELFDVLGQPDTQSEPEVWDADGSEHAIWTYISSGLYLDMTRYSEEAGYVVFSITAIEPCVYETARGVMIGDTKEEVVAAYAKEYNERDSSDDLIVLGSLISGMLVTVEDGIVTGFYIGAMAE